jgi:fused signal recognition particle receptor
MTEKAENTKQRAGFFSRLKSGLSKTRSRFTSSIEQLVLGEKQVDNDLLEEIEAILLSADVGVDATSQIITNMTQKIARKELSDAEAVYESLKNELTSILMPVAVPMTFDSATTRPFVILMVGVNGAGKTTTIGKLAKRFGQEGKSVLLAAGDTYRAAAVEQLKVWGDRNKVEVIAQHTGADSASVVFDALQSGQARQVDVLIADTAGRLQSKKNLMDELEKIQRVMGKLDHTAPHEVLLVLDASTGQNAISQAREFLAAVNVTGIVITKLDGTAKGGVIFAIAKQLGLPIRFVGVGESVEDLREFNASDFVDALFESS